MRSKSLGLTDEHLACKYTTVVEGPTQEDYRYGLRQAHRPSERAVTWLRRVRDLPEVQQAEPAAGMRRPPSTAAMMMTAELPGFLSGLAMQR